MISADGRQGAQADGAGTAGTPAAASDHLTTPAGEPVLPAWGIGTIADIVPSLLGATQQPLSALGEDVLNARAVVLLVLDGLGALQLRDHAAVAPTLAEMNGGTITTVAPSTTATALTSISTGVAPGEHGVVGYRIPTRSGVLNVLSWRAAGSDARGHVAPEKFQPCPTFDSQQPPAIQNAAYAKSGFSRAYLGEARRVGYKVMSSIAVEVRRLLAAGESFIYAYYEGIDVVAHEYGFGEHYNAELAACDRLLTDILCSVPKGTAVVVTADHGQVDCSDGLVVVDCRVLKHHESESGEGRFRWLHARRGHKPDLLAAAREAHGHQAWVHTAEEIIEAGWFGPTVTGTARSRLGDVALVAKDNFAFTLDREHKSKLIGRHGSLTPAEMLVPLLAHVS